MSKQITFTLVASSIDDDTDAKALGATIEKTLTDANVIPGDVEVTDLEEEAEEE